MLYDEPSSLHGAVPHIEPRTGTNAKIVIQGKRLAGGGVLAGEWKVTMLNGGTCPSLRKFRAGVGRIADSQVPIVASIILILGSASYHLIVYEL